VAIANSLAGLTSLNLAVNEIGPAGIEKLLSSLANSKGLKFLRLMNNPGIKVTLTPETFETSDAQSVLAAWRSFSEAESSGNLSALNEAKLLVVGNEAVGKTSLVNYLIDDTPCDPNEKKTPGIRHRERIETKQWSMDESPVRLNVWDFGGQEMMHGTHRYFLTARSIYLLVLEDRREDNPPVVRWMRVISSLAADSPVIILINKSDEGKQALRLDETSLMREYPQIVTILRTSCEDTEWARSSVSTLRETISDLLLKDRSLDHVRTEIPSSWLAVKKEITHWAKAVSVLELDAFRKICVDESVVGQDPIEEPAEQDALLRQLHELGVVVAHGLERDAPAAQRAISLLDPNWLTGAIYTVLTSAKLFETGGEFEQSDLSEWLDPEIYPVERHEFILSMMRHPSVSLCFRLPGDRERFLAPEALPRNTPDYAGWSEGALRFRYKYTYIPRSLIPRLIVLLHDHLTPNRYVWLTGAKLQIEQSEVLIQAYIDRGIVDIAVKGNHCRDSLAVVRANFDRLHTVYKDLKFKEFIAMPDDPDVEEEYDYLRQLEREEGPEYEHRPTGAKRRYKIREILDQGPSRTSYVESHPISTQSDPQDAIPREDEVDIPWYKSVLRLDASTILPWVASAISLFFSMFEFGANLIIGLIIGVAVFTLFRFVARMFDRSFLFRRVFCTWVALGAGMVSLAPISALFEIPSLSINFGSPPTVVVGVIWCVGLIVLAVLALSEAREKGRQ
jgi:small GTP-binding protein